MCFALRLHTSAAPPRGGLTQALGANSEYTSSRKISLIRRYTRGIFTGLPIERIRTAKGVGRALPRKTTAILCIHAC